MKPIDLAPEDRARLADFARRTESQMLSLVDEPDQMTRYTYNNQTLIETAAFWRRVAEAASR